MVIGPTNYRKEATIPFKKVETTRKATEVITQIASAIELGEFSVGDRLPTERDLADAIGVSRTSVREGLSLLGMEGIVERVPGSGTYLASCDPLALKRVQMTLEHSEEPHEIFEWQRLVEPGIALLALEKARPEHLEPVRQALDSMRQAVERSDRDAYSESDREFHLAVADICESALISRQMRQLVALMSQVVWKSMKRYGVAQAEEHRYLEHSLRFHETLYGALLDHDRQAVEIAYQEHYKTVQAVVFDGGSHTE